MKSSSLLFLIGCVIHLSPTCKCMAGEEKMSGTHLFDDIGGHRTALQEFGITYELLYTGEIFWNLDGGIQKGNDYRGDFSLQLELDTQTAGLWKNGLFYLHLQEQHGYGITARYVGDFQVLSNIDADDFKQVSEFWYKHAIINETLWTKIGKMESNADFAFVEYGGEFINSSPGFHPTIPLVSFPDQDWGIVLGIEPVDAFSMNMGLYQGRPDGGRSIGHTLDNLYGPMAMIEPAFHYNLGQHPGHFRLGAWWNGDTFDRFDANNPTPPPFDESYGFYLTWDQEIYKENNREDDEQGIGIFAQYGYTPKERSEVEHYIGAGMQWIGAVPNRDEDILGAGVFHASLSREAGYVQDETAIELF
jgi:porin